MDGPSTSPLCGGQARAGFLLNTQVATSLPPPPLLGKREGGGRKGCNEYICPPPPRGGFERAGECPGRYADAPLGGAGLRKTDSGKKALTTCQQQTEKEKNGQTNIQDVKFSREY